MLLSIRSVSLAVMNGTLNRWVTVCNSLRCRRSLLFLSAARALKLKLKPEGEFTRHGAADGWMDDWYLLPLGFFRCFRLSRLGHGCIYLFMMMEMNEKMWVRPLYAALTRALAAECIARSMILHTGQGTKFSFYNWHIHLVSQQSWSVCPVYSTVDNAIRLMEALWIYTWRIYTHIAHTTVRPNQVKHVATIYTRTCSMK